MKVPMVSTTSPTESSRPAFNFAALHCRDLNVPGLKKPFPSAESTPQELMEWLQEHHQGGEVGMNEASADSLDFSLGSSVFSMEEGVEVGEIEEDPFAEALPDLEEEIEIAKVGEENTAEKLQSGLVKPPQALGFATATGREIPISTEALAKARMLWKETVSDDEGTADKLKSNPVNPSKPALGFTTAKGGGITVSTEALAKARLLWKDTVSDDNRDAVEKFQSNQVSDDGDTVEKLHSSPVNPSKPLGFATAMGREITVSTEALVKARMLWKETVSDDGDTLEKLQSNQVSDDEDTVEKLQSSPVKSLKALGFATAKGKEIAISTEALEKARLLWKEIVVDDVKEIVHSEAIIHQPKRRKLEEVPGKSITPPPVTVSPIISVQGFTETTNSPSEATPKTGSGAKSQRRIGLSRRSGNFVQPLGDGSPTLRPMSESLRPKSAFKAPTRVHSAIGPSVNPTESQEFEAEVGQWMEEFEQKL